MRSLSQLALQIAVGVVLVVAVIWAWNHPGRFDNIEVLSTVFFFEILFVLVWHFERYFFAAVVISFLWAGVAVPFQSAFNMGRWVVLGCGAIVGFILWMKSSHRTFGAFHLVAAFCVLSAMVSSVVSEYPVISMSKSASLFLLFLYGAAGVRLAVLGRQEQFFSGLVVATEIVVFLTAICYFGLGIKVFGNPNSLGAVMGVAVFPILLWAFLTCEKAQRTRRSITLLLCCFLLLYSVARSAILGAAVVALILCLSLREYRLILKSGLALVVVLSLVAIIAPSYFQRTVTNFADEVIYKGHKDQGVLGSRESPWDLTVTAIRNHPFFGSGFGTSPSGDDPGFVTGEFSSTAEVSREHGSSYLAMVDWVGLLGVLPFIVLLFLVVRNVARTCSWMVSARSPFHYAIPLAMVMVAGLVNAGFEDWLFAAGSYPALFFWSLAFILDDLVPVRVGQTPASSTTLRYPIYPLATAASKR